MDTKEKTVAELELAAREKIARDLVISKIMMVPNITEMTDNPDTITLIDMIKNFQQTDEYKAESKRWRDIQVPIMETLKFEGCEVKTYDSEVDGLSGAYLRYTSSPYIVDIDAEDVESLEEIRTKGYLTIMIFKRIEDADDYNVLADGVVANITQAMKICQSLTSGSEKEATALVKTYDELYISMAK